MNKVLCASLLVLLASVCYAEDQKPRVYNGDDAEAGEYPFIALVQYYDQFNASDDGTVIKGTWQCDASILSSRVLLTAAHCAVNDVYDADGNVTEALVVIPRNYIITVGDTNLTSTEGTEQYLNISGVIVHPEYDGNTVVNDIAMLITETDINLDSTKATIALPSDDDIASLNAEGAAITVIGWGTTETGDVTEELQELSYVVTSAANCEATWGDEDILPGMMCTGASPDIEIKHSGAGDSGGPLFTMVNGTWTQLALVSWGASPGEFTNVTYDVNTNVSYYKSWIETNMNIALTDYISELYATDSTQTVTYSNLRNLLYKSITIKPNNSTKYTKITVKNGTLLEYDFVQIYDGNSVRDEMLVEFTNGTLEGELSFTASTTNGLTLAITTGQYNQSEGFTLEFSQVSEAGHSMNLICSEGYAPCNDNYYCYTITGANGEECSGAGYCNDGSDDAHCDDEDEDDDDGNSAIHNTASCLIIIAMSYFLN